MTSFLLFILMIANNITNNENKNNNKPNENLNNLQLFDFDVETKRKEIIENLKCKHQEDYEYYENDEYYDYSDEEIDENYEEIEQIQDKYEIYFEKKNKKTSKQMIYSSKNFNFPDYLPVFISN